MNPGECTAIAAIVTGMVQVFKHMGMQDNRGLIATGVLTVLLVLLFAASQDTPFARALVWTYTEWCFNVFLQAAGLFGVIRHSQTLVTRMTPPKDGDV